MLDDAFNKDSENWIDDKLDSLTDDVIHKKPSEWAEEKRWLPESTTPISGYFNWDNNPNLKEILDCFDPYSPVSIVDLMKGAQIGATVSILENIIGYVMDHVKTSPLLMVTADKILAKDRLEKNIEPMIRDSDLEHLISSNDDTSNRKTGKSGLTLSWLGGGWLSLIGALVAARFRSLSVPYILEDEVDTYPILVGKDGDTQKLIETRAQAYSQKKKIFRVSTPLIKGASRIEDGFEKGDKRYRMVPCLKCGTMQMLRFYGKCKFTGHEYGLKWSYKGERSLLDYDSVRYVCMNPDCGYGHRNEQKHEMFLNGHWWATSTPDNPRHRSYHLSQLYAPADFGAWSEIVEQWLESWDVDQDRVKNSGSLQEFYNNKLGETYEITGKRLSIDEVSVHRRNFYSFGEINNTAIAKHTGSRVLLVTCAVDVQADYLSVSTMGWAKWTRPFVIEYFELEGDTSDLDSELSPWRALKAFMQELKYVADDGYVYRLAITMVDSGFNTETVYDFCLSCEHGVYPIKGDDTPVKKGIIKEFSTLTTPSGLQGYLVWVNYYKDRWYSALKREWSGQGEMPKTFFSAPVDMTHKQLKELTGEKKIVLIDPDTQKVIGAKWIRTRANELWDLLNYNNLGLDVIAYDLCREVYELDTVNWSAFWDFIEQNQTYFLDPIQASEEIT